MAFKRISFFGLPLDVGGTEADLCQLMRGKNTGQSITFAGPEAWALAGKNPDYVNNLKQMSLVLPSGQVIATACYFFTRETCSTFSFDMTSFARRFFTIAAEEKMTLALVGGQPRDDEDTQEKLKKYFPGLDIVETTHGYGELAPKIEAVMAKKPKAVLVAMGAPRQEAFLVALRAAGYKGLALGCGNFFEGFMSTADYLSYPAWVDRLHLMPLYRLTKEPQRLWQRYIFGYIEFTGLVLKGFVGMLTEKGDAVAARVKKK